MKVLVLQSSGLGPRVASVEQTLRTSFESHRRAGSKAMFVFADAANSQINIMGTHSDCADVVEHLRWNRQECPDLYHTLLVALDTRQDFESQWRTAGQVRSFDDFREYPLITTGIKALLPVPSLLK